MLEFLIFFLMAGIVFYHDWETTAQNMNMLGNGFGAAANILDGRDTPSPAQYRLLVPGIMAVIAPFKFLHLGGDRIARFGQRLPAYITVKFLGILLCLSFVQLFFASVLAHGVVAWAGTGIFALWLIFSQEYDYADTYFEAAFFAMAFYLLIPIGIHGYADGSVAPLFPIVPVVFWYPVLVIAATFNKPETAFFLPFLAWLTVDWQFGAIMFLVYAVSCGCIRLIGGKRRPYTTFFQWKANAFEFWEMLHSGGVFFWNRSFHFLVCTVFFFGVCLFVHTRSVIGFISILYFVLALGPGKWREIRIFTVPMIYAIAAIFVRITLP